MDKRKKRGRQFVVTGSNPPEIFETLEKAFNLIAVLIKSFVVFLRISLVFTRRDTSLCLPILNIREDFGGVIPPVGENFDTFSDDITQ